MKGTKASFFLHSHPHPSLGAGMEAGQQYGGTDGGSAKGGVRGPVTDTLSCPEPLRQSALPIVRQHPFLYPSPTLSAPCCAPIQQIVSGGPDVDLFLQVPYL